MAKRTKLTINAIKTANDASGGTWFGPSEMSYFSTRVEPTVYQGADGLLFVTSEAYDHKTPRRYSVRLARTDATGAVFGPIETIGDFLQYATLAEAVAAIN